MRRLWQLGTRNWRTSPGRTFAALLSVALGVGTVVIITSFYETARRAIREEVVNRWLGSAHLSIHPPGAHWGTIEASLVDDLVQIVAHERRPSALSHFPKPVFLCAAQVPGR